MKIKEITLTGFKGFKSLKITGLLESAKLVVLVGPNGSGKSSVFEAFNQWNNWYAYRDWSSREKDFYLKKGLDVSDEDWFKHSVELKFYGGTPNQEAAHRAFYFRTAYRNEADFTTESISRMGDPSAQIRFQKLINTDASVSNNYKRLASLTLKGVYSGEYDGLSVKNLREFLIGKVQKSMSRVFDNLQLEGVGDPLVNGSFYFTKGESKGFHYKNLSAGEKSAFDLILDMVVQKQYYPQAIYCIDEPETHMHTSLQSRLLEELYIQIPEAGQMWVATHSLGMLKTAREIETAHPGTVAFLDFTDLNFDTPAEIRPTKIDATIWNRFMDLAFGDLANLVAPQTIVFCEGNPISSGNKNFDAGIYQRIFNGIVPTPRFVSIGSCNDVEDDNNVSMLIVKSILNRSRTIRLIDRDRRTDEQIADAAAAGIRVLSRRHLESYLLDDEVLSKLCQSRGKPEAINDVLQIKRQAITDAVARRRDDNDIKAASGTMIDGIRRILAIRDSGSVPGAFFRDIIAPLITSDMAVYRELERDVFGGGE